MGSGKKAARWVRGRNAPGRSKEVAPGVRDQCPRAVSEGSMGKGSKGPEPGTKHTMGGGPLAWVGARDVCKGSNGSRVGAPPEAECTYIDGKGLGTPRGRLQIQVPSTHARSLHFPKSPMVNTFLGEIARTLNTFPVALHLHLSRGEGKSTWGMGDGGWGRVAAAALGHDDPFAPRSQLAPRTRRSRNTPPLRRSPRSLKVIPACADDVGTGVARLWLT
jgi:hypothetical protein